MPGTRFADVLVADFDRTLADENGRVISEALDALRQWRAAGGLVVINTGRRAGDFFGENPGSVFPEWPREADYLVAENGSVVVEAASGEMHLLGDPLPAGLQREIATSFTPAFISPYRLACIKTLDPAGPRDDPNAIALRAMVRRYNQASGTQLTIAQNIDSLMVVSAGIDKLTGLMRALMLAKRRGINHRRIVGVGDAPNDAPFLLGCSVSVSVEGGARMRGRVDFIARGLMGLGVAEATNSTRLLRDLPAEQLDTVLQTRMAPGRTASERAQGRRLARRYRRHASMRAAAHIAAGETVIDKSPQLRRSGFPGELAS